jgi:hypothetical protein
MPFSADSFSIRVVGTPHIATFRGGYEAGLKQVELLAAVYLSMPLKDRKQYGHSVVKFIDFAWHHPGAVQLLQDDVGPLQFGLWSETDLSPVGKVH